MEMNGYKTENGLEQADIVLCCEDAQREWNLSVGFDTLSNNFVMWRTCRKYGDGLGNHLQVSITFCPFCGDHCIVKPKAKS